MCRPEAPREGRLGQRSSALARTMSGSCGSAVSASGHRRSRLRFGRWTRMRLILGLLVVDPQPLEPLRPAAIQDAFHPHLVAGRPPRPTHDRSPRWARSSGPGHDERLRSRMRPTQPRQGTDPPCCALPRPHNLFHRNQNIPHHKSLRRRGLGGREPGPQSRLAAPQFIGATEPRERRRRWQRRWCLAAQARPGRRIVQRLQAAGRPVRVGTPSATPPFDWTDEATWPAALDDVGSVYVTYYPDVAIPGAAAVGAFAELAVATGARRLVLLSGRGEEGALASEKALRASGADWTIVRSTFMDQTSTRASSWSRCGPARSPSPPTRTWPSRSSTPTTSPTSRSRPSPGTGTWASCMR